MPKEATSVIIGTLAQATREQSLKRAIQSIRLSSRDPVKVIVVVNGNHFDISLCNWLKSQPDVIYSYLDEASLPLALLKGRQLVETEFFSFLDDDDEYLLRATDYRLACLREHLEVDLLICNGYVNCDGVKKIIFDDLNNVLTDPLSAIFNRNWLASCGGIFRTSSIGCNYFQDGMAFLEWTWLAFLIASAGHKIQILDSPTFVINDTPESASKSEKYLRAHIHLYERMLGSNPRADLIPIINHRLANAWHNISDHQRTSGKLMDSWLSHLKCLQYPEGWRFLSYTKNLIGSSLAFGYRRKC